MRPNILSSLIDTIQTHVGFTRDLGELQQMRDDIVSSREAIKPSVIDGIRQNREARAAMYDALIALIDVQISKYSDSHPCESCGVMVPTTEYCGNTRPDGSTEYLCESCYVPDPRGNFRTPECYDQKYIHDWLIVLVDFDWTPDVLVAIHKDVATMKAVDAADHSVPDPEDNISRFGPSTCAHSLAMDDIDGLHADVNAVYCLIDSGLIDGKRALKMFRNGGAA